jgi:uncharacterized protein (TIGR00369 family)
VTPDHATDLAATGTPMEVTIPGHLFAAIPFYDILDTEETVVVDLHKRPDLLNIRGAVQGGLIATLIDIAGGRLAIKHTGAGAGAGTADMTIHFVAPVVTGPARATATLVRAGRRSVVVAVNVTDVGRNRLAARSTLSFAILEPR